ncbi:16S rRNA (cytosine(967)-C(5))-methyltransferase RsmB [Ruminococcaceae bacterium OttesenSCG-928-L11]|nr:16S rRNA (cytosine(967)-C(5))-methyltransferase RsmB [Ruminococcaceae bacterium OttesenSCG-928-L11]
MKSARQVAVEALLRVEEGKSWSNLTLDALLTKHITDPREGAFASALVYGVLERKLTLDACIAAHSKLKLSKLSPVIHAILRITVYQLLYMDKVPDHSAVNEAVELTRTLKMGKTSGFVNGILRAFLRDEKRIPIPAEPLSAALGVEYSVPEPLVTLWLEAYGEEKTLAILQASMGQPPQFIRVNTLRTTDEALLARLEARGYRAEETALAHCFILSGPGAAVKLPEFEEGLFHVQDISSQLCVKALQVALGMRVLDACAAPGGKSLTIAQYLGGEGALLSTDLRENRVPLMQKQAERMGISQMECRRADMTVLDPSLGQFDRVLCDVPCSGYGVIRRKPEIKYKPLEEFSGLPEIQYKILRTASHYVKEGGRLIYSTCTLHPVENSGVVRRFLEENLEFVPVPLEIDDSAETERTLIGHLQGDGFFMAALQRASR